MHTVRCSGHLRMGVVSPGGMSAQGLCAQGVCAQGVCAQGVSAQGVSGQWGCVCLGGGVWPEGCLPRGFLSRGCLPRGGCMPRGVYTSHQWTDRHLCKHNLSATTVADGKNCCGVNLAPCLLLYRST